MNRVELLREILRAEPHRSCSCPRSRDRCGGCLRHDHLRESLAVTIAAAQAVEKDEGGA